MSKHTPGPWTHGKSVPFEGAMERFVISQAEGAGYTPGFSDVAETVFCERLDVQESNARLIAAAPELLEALQNLMERVQYDKDAKNWFTDEQKAARAAIAKATGETQC